MRLLLDECAGDRGLTKALVAGGHDVARSVDVLGGGAVDSTVFAFACAENRSILTYNAVDFIDLAMSQLVHPGLLLMYRDDRQTDIPARGIVKILANVEAVHPGGIASQIIVLNQYAW
jgi:predicted nuclease of predicted toxin-antitoxin system